MTQRIVTLGGMLVLLVALAAPALAQTPPDGCYLVEDGQIIDVVTGEPCVPDGGGEEVEGVIVSPAPPATAAPTVPSDEDEVVAGVVAAPAQRASAPAASRGAARAPVASAQLAATGFGLSGGAVLAFALLALGGTALLLSNRRKRPLGR